MATSESKVVVAPDSTGKAIRNLQVTTLIDGVPTVVQMQVIALANDMGQTIDLDIAHLLEDLVELNQTMAYALTQLVGGDALEGSEENLCERGFIPGLWAQTGLPREVNSYAPARMLGDRFGRQVVIPWGPRDLYVTATPATITDNTSKTLIAGQPDVFLDLVALVISNTSAASNTRIDVSDGTNTYPFQSIGGAGPVGFSMGSMVLPATTRGATWTIISSASVTDIRVFAVFVKNR